MRLSCFQAVEILRIIIFSLGMFKRHAVSTLLRLLCVCFFTFYHFQLMIFLSGSKGTESSWKCTCALSKATLILTELHPGPLEYVKEWSPKVALKSGLRV